MLTLHRAGLLVTDPAAPPVADGAVLVDAGRVAALGPYRDLVAAGGARVREWPGVLVPGLANPAAAWLLEHRYHPDPREELGSEPLDVPVPAGQRGGSARRGLQRMLAHGATAVAGPFTDPAVRTAVTRSGLSVLPGDGREGGLDPLAGRTLAEAVHRPLVVGGAADFAVFAADGPSGPETADHCLATVLGGRIVHRRR